MLILPNAIELWKWLVIDLPFLIWDDFQTVILWYRQIFSFWQEERKAKRYHDLTKMTWVGAKSPNLNPGLLLPCNQLLTSHIMFLQGYSFPLKKMTFSAISLWTCSFTDIVTSNGKRLLPECFLRHPFVLWIIHGFLHSPQEGHHISYVLGFLLKLSGWIALSHTTRENTVSISSIPTWSWVPLGLCPHLIRIEETVILHPPTRGSVRWTETVITIHLKTWYNAFEYFSISNSAFFHGFPKSSK